MAMRNLHDLFVDEVKDLYSAENQLVKALPKMIKAADSMDLKNALSMHLEETRNQVTRIEQIAEQHGFAPKGKKCVGMEGIVQEGSELLEKDADPAAKDAGLIGAAQRVEHYEIASYGTARTFAETLGYGDAAQLLQQTLDEEKQADAKLTSLAEGHINREATSPDGQAGGMTGRM